MKVEVKEGEKTTLYPYLGKHGPSSKVVLFIRKGCGLVVAPNAGQYSEEWNEGTFTPFTGSVTLSN